MQELLNILQHDRKFGDNAGRKGLLAVLDLLGNEGDLVADYRRKLFNSLHWKSIPRGAPVLHVGPAPGREWVSRKNQKAE